MKILLTGGAGFIGSALSTRLAENGHEVIAIDNLNSYYHVKLKIARLAANGIKYEDCGTFIKSSTLSGLSFLKLSLEDREGMEKLFKEEKFDKVVNLAAQAGVRYSISHPYEYLQSNITGFMVLLECCRNYGVEHLIFASSSSVYGSENRVPFSEDDKTDKPVSLYAATKKADEALAYSYHSLFGIRMTGLRYFTVYGPWGRPDMAPFLFADAITSGKPINIFNRGHLMRDFTHIDDIVGATEKIVNDEKQNQEISDYEIYNVGCSDPVQLMDFISEMEQAFGREALKNWLPMQPGDVYATHADVTKLARDYGYKPTTTLHDGITDFATWYLSPLNPLKIR